MEYELLLCQSVMGLNPINQGFFRVMDSKYPCYSCQNMFKIHHVSNSNKLWCAHCFGKRFCDIVRETDKKFKIILKKNKKTLYDGDLAIFEKIENEVIHNERVDIPSIGKTILEMDESLLQRPRPQPRPLPLPRPQQQQLQQHLR